MQCVQLVLAVTLLRADAFSALQPHRQIAHGLGVMGRKVSALHLALHLANDDTQNCALAFEHPLQAPELFGVGVATSLPAQGFALFGKSLFELNAGALGSTHNLVARDLQQAAVHRVRDGFFLDGGVDYHALQVFGFDGLNGNGCVDGGLEQQLQAFLAQVAAKASDLRGIAWQPMLKIIHAAEELPEDVLAPAHHQLFVAEIEAVLEVQQAGHQANRQLGASGIAAACAHQGRGGAKHVLTLKDLACAMLALKLLHQCRLYLIPGQPSREYRQRIVQIDHGVNAATEKVNRLHLQIPQKSTAQITFLEGFGARHLHKKASVHAG